MSRKSGSKVFIKYAPSAGGYELLVPDGRCCKTGGMDVSFIDKLDGFSGTIVHQSHTPDLESIRTNKAARPRRNGRAVIFKVIKEVKWS